MTYEKSLTQMGLSENEALAYDALLSLGKAGVRDLLKRLPIKRANLYAVLYALKNRNLLSEIEERGKKKFIPESPERLNDIVLAAEKRAIQAKNVTEMTLPLLLSQYNLSSGKPTITFWEGAEAFKHILGDSLTAEETIYAYIDNDLVNQYFGKEDKEYREKREKLVVKKKFIALDTPSIHRDAHLFDPSVTEVRLIPKNERPLSTETQIYDGKVSFLTLTPTKIIGIIIKDDAIYATHRILFEEAWKHATPLAEALPAPSTRAPEPPKDVQ
jgi:sugar-specific transcriptional regulator TrmB